MLDQSALQVGIRVLILEIEKFQHQGVLDGLFRLIASAGSATAPLASIAALLFDSAVRS